MNATETLYDMQSKLATAERDLSDFKAIMGELAATNYLPDLAQRLAELQAAVTVAAAAVATAQAHAPDPRIAAKQQQITTALAAADHWRELAERYSAIQAQHEAPYIQNRDLALEATRHLMAYEAQALTRQLELQELTQAA